jgi:nicotinamide-nucleotide amidase
MSCHYRSGRKSWRRVDDTPNIETTICRASSAEKPRTDHVVQSHFGRRRKGLLARAKAGGFGLITAESCTSGLLASVLSEAPGAAQLLHGGFVTYTKENNAVALGVSAALLKTKGAVCEEVARAMAEGALERSPAEVSVAITGVAGPLPDADGNPVGLVCIAVARRGFPTSSMQQDYGDIGRDALRERAMQDALAALTAALDDRTGEPSRS